MVHTACKFTLLVLAIAVGASTSETVNEVPQGLTDEE